MSVRQQDFSRRAVTRAWLAGAATGLIFASLVWPVAVSAERQHVVRPGQSLEVIAKQYKVKASELAAANGLTADEALHGGQVLTVPPEGVVYVASGQTLSSIAHDHGLGFAELVVKR
jgi:LysM repeat protein